MSGPSIEEPTALPPELVELKSQLSRRLAGPLPETFEERVKLLESHLRESLDGLKDQPLATFAITPDNLTQSIQFVRETVAEVFEQTRSSSTRDFSECDVAAAEGVALITFGCVLGPHAGLLAFGAAVYHLTQHCGEG